MKWPKFLTPSNWETIYSFRASAYKGGLFRQTIIITSLVRVQVDNLKNKYRCILTDGVDEQEIEIDYILASMPRDESTKLRRILSQRGIKA